LGSLEELEDKMDVVIEKIPNENIENNSKSSEKILNENNNIEIIRKSNEKKFSEKDQMKQIKKKKKNRREIEKTEYTSKKKKIKWNLKKQFQTMTEQFRSTKKPNYFKKKIGFNVD